MGIKEIRRDNLRLILEQRFKGNKAALARGIDRPAPNVHGWIKAGMEENPKEARWIGEKLARDIESKLFLSYLWLDTDHSKEGVAMADQPPAYTNPRHEALIRLFDALPQSEQDRVMSHLEEKKQDFDRLWEEMSKQRAPGLKSR